MQISPLSHVFLSCRRIGPIFAHGPQCDILLEGTCDLQGSNESAIRPLTQSECNAGSHFHFESGSQFVSQFPIADAVVDTARQRVFEDRQIGTVNFGVNATLRWRGILLLGSY